MRTIWEDLRYATRALWRNPTFSIVAILSLTLGIGANSAIFSTLNALVFRELPVHQAKYLVELSGLYRNGERVPLSFPLFEEVERAQRVFSGFFGWTANVQANVEVKGALSLAEVSAVSGSYYSNLGSMPLRGRLITSDDASTDIGKDSHVAVIGYDFWVRTFDRDPAVVGRTINIEGQPFTIIGVTQRWFTGLTPGEPPEITIPITTASVILGDSVNYRSALWVFATGRLKDGVTIQRARAQVKSFWSHALKATAPTEGPGERLQSWLSMGLEMQSAATGTDTDLRSEFKQPLYLLMGIVTLILLVACVNLASLTLARAAVRGHEMSIRMALGASRRRVVCQLLSESVLLSVTGSLPALVFAYWGSRFLLSLMSRGTLVPIALDLRPDWRVLLFTEIVAILTGLLVGFGPALEVSREEPISGLRQVERTFGRGTNRFSKALIVTQIALSLVLLQGAGLFLRTFQNLLSLDPGFQQRNVLEVSLYPRPGGYKDMDLNRYRPQLLERIANLPDVSSVSFSDLLVPAGGSGWTDTVSPMATGSNTGASLLATLAVVSPDFFKTLEIPLIRGRDFDWMDNGQHQRVVVIDTKVARQLFPSGNVIGERIRFGVQSEFQDLQIVGVVHAARLVDLHDANAPVVYAPFAQHPNYGFWGNLLVRANHPGAFVKPIEDEIWSLGREYSTGAETLKQASGQALLKERVTAMLSSFFAVVALLLAGIGLFGLLSYLVTQRTREIGIRMVLGAQRNDLLRLVMRQGMQVVLTGIAIGFVATLGLTRLIAGLLFGVSAMDSLTFTGVVSLLALVALTACYIPARRAMCTDPLVALKDQ